MRLFILSIKITVFLLSNKTIVGGKVLYKFADEKEREVHRGRETEAMVQMLSQYKSLCGKREVMVIYPYILAWIYRC